MTGIKIVDANTGELLPAPRNLPNELFIEFDRQDGDQIMAELRGGVVAEYVYQFQQGGQTITGLSLAGVMAVAQQMGGIVCGQPVWTMDDEEITCDISATDHHKGLTVWGTATETRWMETRNGRRFDKFARSKALSKAQRNAIRKLIPEKLASEMLAMFIEQQGKQGNERSRRSAPQLPAAKTPDEPALPDEALNQLREHAFRCHVTRIALANESKRRYGTPEFRITVAQARELWQWCTEQAPAPSEPQTTLFDPEADADMVPDEEPAS